MASASLSATSPPSPPSISDSSADTTRSVQGRLPSRHITNPRGRITSPQNVSASPQLASTRYVHQYRALMDHQRRVFEEERELWHTERSDLLAEVEQLKARLRQFGGSAEGEISSPNQRQGSGTNFQCLVGSSSNSSSRHTSTGDEFWRGAGGRSDAQPTRTFSDLPIQPHTNEERWPSISENEPPQAQGSLLTASINEAINPRITSVLHGDDIDGITFKSSSLTSSHSTNIMKPQSPSPLYISPGTLTLPASELAPLLECNTVHAGHTPIARGSRYNTDGSASAISSSPTTPTQPEVERPPCEPRASFVRPPGERSDSYFTGAVLDQGEDPELNEPLGLENRSTSETESFLEAVDSKLEEAARKEDDESRRGRKSATEDDSTGHGRAVEQPEHSEPEPKLRIKSSMNFGSQLGSLR